MAARLDDVDFTGICQCIPPVPDYTCKQESQTWQHVIRIVVKLPPYLNSSAISAFSSNALSMYFTLKSMSIN